MQLDVKSIPPELRRLPQWVVWCFEKRADGKLTKVPYNPRTGRFASSTKSQTWSRFRTAYRGVSNGKGYSGIGFVLSADDPYTVLDLDHCIENGMVAPWAQEIVERLSSYSEVSQSGKGLHVIVKAKKPGARCKTGYHGREIEIYSNGRYFVMTGQHLDGTPTNVEKRQEELAQVYDQVFAPPSPARTFQTLIAKRRQISGPDSSSDEKLLQKAMEAANGEKFSRLWAGDTSGYPSPSEADFALCSQLAFWTDSFEQIDRLFRSSGLFRDKWDRSAGQNITYGERTIRKAIETMTDSYSTLHEVRREERETDETKPDFFHLTEAGNAKRLAMAYGDRIRYCPPWSKWLVYDGRMWKRDQECKIEALAKDIPRMIHTEAARTSNADMREALGKWAVKSESENRVKAAIWLARSEPGIPIKPETLDEDPWLLNCLNGTVDLRTGKIRPHRREDLITRIVPVEYDPKASCPKWREFLNKVMNGNDGLIAFLQLAVGYSLTGITDERCFFILYGSGRNGKGTFIETIAAMMRDYALRIPTETLLAKRWDSIPNDIASLRGARFVYASESEQGRRLAESRVKDLTGGGDTISARFLYGEHFEFKPECKLWLSTNHKPVIKGTDDAIWDRIRLIPFTVRIAEHEEIPRHKMAAMLSEELPGILAWAVEGCLIWQEQGLGTPEEVIGATGDYRAEMDVLASFLDDCCVIGPDTKISSGQVYDLYRKWCEDNGEPPLSRKRLGGRLHERGYKNRRHGQEGRIWWFGLGGKT